MKRLIEDSCESPNPIVRVHGWKGTLSDGSACSLTILTHHSVYSAIMEQAEAALPNETGGFLLGHTGFDPDCENWYNWIDEVVGITTAEATPVHFSFTWKDVDQVRAHREDSGKSLIGWYHTHPGLGIFLSETDLQKTHHRLFNEIFQVALVYDPISGRAGYFFREPSGFIDAGTADWREFHLVKSVSGSDAGSAEARTIPSISTMEQQS